MQHANPYADPIPVSEANREYLQDQAEKKVKKSS